MDTPYPKGLNIRLEIIRNLIAIGELEETKDQAKKLRIFAEADKIAEIISLLEKNKFHDALKEIEHFMQVGKQIITADESELIALRMELTSLKQKLAESEEEKASIEAKVKEFQFRYQRNLGLLTEEFLRLKKVRLAKESAEDTEKAAEFEEAKKEHAEYQETMRGLSKESHFELSSEEEADLKKAFRKACKLCHPDMVSEEYKIKAQSIFIELREAYVKNDVIRVHEILKHLEEDVPLTDNVAIDTIEALKLERDRLREKIAKTETEIKALKDGNVYSLIESINNWDGYFNDKKAELIQEIELLKREINAGE